jgi:nucleoside-diphosphate kinase
VADPSRTLILVKPDAFERGLTGEVLARFERKGLRIVALRQLSIDEEFAGRHYEEHTDKPFFGEVIGATNPLEASPGSIRGDFALEVTFNLVHGSDSPESAEREIVLWFPDLD